jgi:hypothetical protein
MEYNKLASQETINATVAALKERNVEAIVVADKAAALAKIKELIPAGASIMNGASVTLEQIGYIDYLKAGEHGWNNLHAGIVAEKDPAKQGELRKQAELSDYYLGSVHGLAATGEMVIASNSGSQLPHIVFTSPNLIFVAGVQKIVPTLADAMNRLHDYVIPLEEVHMQQLYKAHTYPSKIVIFNRESPMSKRNVKLILVNEVLGF